MAKLPICPDCGLEVTNNQPSKKIKGKTHHLSCHQNKLKEKYENKKNETESINEKQELYNYIKLLFNIPEVTAMIDKQVEKYCLDYKLEYSDIKDILHYYFDTCGNPVNSEGIGILPYIVHDAKEHFRVVKESRANNEEQLKTVKKLKEVKPISVTYKRKEDTYKNKVIDIENL